MKNLYAILAAAVVASGAASAQLPRTSVEELARTPLDGIQMLNTSVPKTQVKTVASQIQGQSTRKAPAYVKAGDAVPTFKFGDYVFTYADSQEYEDGSVDPLTASLYPTIISKDQKNVSDTTVVVSQFFYNDAEDMPAVVAYQDVQFQDGTQTVPVMTIDSWEKAPFLYFDVNKDGTPDPYYLVLMTAESFYTQPVDFIIDEIGEIWFPYPSEVAIGFIAPVGGKYYGGPLSSGVALWEKNAEQTVKLYVGDVENYDPTKYEEFTLPVWTRPFQGYYVDDNDQPTGEEFIGVFATGWGACGTTIRFILREEDGTTSAKAENQVGWNYNDENYYLIDCEFAEGSDEPGFKWVINGKNYDWMVANVTKDADGNTVFEQDGDWLMMDTKSIVMYWKEGTTVFDYDLFEAAGVKDVEIEGVEDVNAPVEYYNLQGVKVANPTHGQLYIVKQGSKVSKVIR